jgi:hypothetical protein
LRPLLSSLSAFSAPHLLRSKLKVTIATGIVVGNGRAAETNAMESVAAVMIEGESAGMMTTTDVGGVAANFGSILAAATTSDDAHGLRAAMWMRTAMSSSDGAASATEFNVGRSYMHGAILVAVGLIVAATAVQAQSSRRDEPWEDSWRGERREWRDDRDHRRGDDRRGRDERRADDDRQGRSLARSGGTSARFMVRSGDTRLGVVCDEAETMRNCVDAALLMFDRVRQAAPAGSPTSAPPASPSPSR